MNSTDKYLEFLKSPIDPKDIKNATVDDLDVQINTKKDLLEILEGKISCLQEMLNELEDEVSSMIQEIETTDAKITSKLQKKAYLESLTDQKLDIKEKLIKAKDMYGSLLLEFEVPESQIDSFREECYSFRGIYDIYVPESSSIIMVNVRMKRVSLCITFPEIAHSRKELGQLIIYVLPNPGIQPWQLKGTIKRMTDLQFFSGMRVLCANRYILVAPLEEQADMINKLLISLAEIEGDIDGPLTWESSR